jgi:uncharacterized membrane protein YgcG
MLSLCVASGRCIQTVITGSALLAISGTEEQYVGLYRQTEELNGVVPHQQLPPHTTAATAAAITASSALPLSLSATAKVAPATVAAAVQQHALIRGTGRTPGIRSSATSSSGSSSNSTVHNDWGLSAVRHNGTSNSSSKASHSSSSSSSSSSSGSAAAVQRAVAGRDVVIADLGGLLFERRYTQSTG